MSPRAYQLLALVFGSYVVLLTLVLTGLRLVSNEVWIMVALFMTLLTLTWIMRWVKSTDGPDPDDEYEEDFGEDPPSGVAPGIQ